MLLLALALLAIIALATLVVVFVAYPQQDRAMPRATRLSGSLQRLVDRTGLDPDENEAATGGTLTELHEQWRDGRRHQVPREQDDSVGGPAPRR